MIHIIKVLIETIQSRLLDFAQFKQCCTDQAFYEVFLDGYVGPPLFLGGRGGPSWYRDGSVVNISSDEMKQTK
jgi:hypothetical protein